MSRLINQAPFIAFLLCWIVLTISAPLFAQQEASFSQYMFNQQAVNPAYVGAQDFTQITLLNHTQWINLEGAPETQALSAGTRLSDKIGIGISAVNDKIGPAQNTTTSIDFAYHISLNDNNLKLGLGLKVSGRLNSLDLSDIQTIQTNDNSFSIQPQDNANINFGTGFYLYNQKFYIGLAVPFLLEEETFNLQRNYYMILGGIFQISESIQLKPSLLFQKTQGVDLIYDSSVWMVFNNRFWVGPQYRAAIESIVPSKNMGGFFGAIAGIHLGKNISLGYAYQGRIGNQALGITNTTHEILLRFQFVSKFKGVLRSPRLF